MSARTPWSLCVFFLLAAPADAGEKLDVQPGKWEMTIESTSSMMPQPQVTKRTECITEEELDTDKLMERAQACSVSDVTSSGDRLLWNLHCKVEGGEMKGKADYRSLRGGQAVEGRMHMTMAMGGMTMTMDHTYEGKRIGDCD